MTTSTIPNLMMGRLRLTQPVKAELTSDLEPVPGLFSSALAEGAADADVGKLQLHPGSWFLSFTGRVRWHNNVPLVLRLVVGDDPRFLAPGVVLEPDRRVDELLRAVNLKLGLEVTAKRFLPPAQHFAAHGCVEVPAVAGNAPLELRCRVASEATTFGIDVLFEDLEVIAFRIGAAVLLAEEECLK